jgi:TolB protein
MRFPGAAPRLFARQAAVVLLMLSLLLLASCDDSESEEQDPDSSPTPAGQTPPLPTNQTGSGNCPDPEPEPPQEASISDLSGRISYVRLIFGCNPEVFIMNGDGGDATNLSNNPALDDEPHISPDGSQVVFFSTRDGEAYLYLVNADGSDLRRLSENLSSGGDASPRWSPDGARIAFSQGGNIAVANADGSDLKVIMESQPGVEAEVCRGGSFVGSWSPDGQRITYYSGVLTSEVARYEVCAINADGSGIQPLVTDPVGGLHAEPFWSPDGKMIAFRDDRDGPCGGNVGCNYDIFTLNLETGEQKNVTNNPALDIEPSWSPDGEWIIFSSNREDPNFDIYIVHPDGSDVRRLMADPASKDSYTSWSP